MRWTVLTGILALAATPASAFASKPDRQTTAYQDPQQQILDVTGQASGGGSSWIWIGLLLLLAFWIVKRARAPAKPPKKTKTQLNNEAALLAFGATAEERQTNIDAAFDHRDRSIEFLLDWEHYGQRLKGTIMRSLSTMSPRERETLRAVYHLYNLGMNASEGNTHIARFGIVFGDGKGTLWGKLEQKNLSTEAGPGIEGAIKWAQSVNLESSINLAINDLNAAVRLHPDHPLLRSLAARLYGDGGDMAPDVPLKSAGRSEAPPYGLILGLDENDPAKQWFFDGEGSLLTVAPPGSGKTQCHVFPNLLQWPGPAVVLDVKGEIYAQTSKWRAENVGPVFRFNPLDPAHSHCYNPLSAVRADLEYLWEDSRFLADMMIVPTGKAKDPFWESRARDVVTAAIARTCISGDAPAMADMLDILHGVGWERFVAYMQARTDFRSMSRAGHSLGEMETKTRDGVLQQALSSMSAWDGERIARATGKSDWKPLDLRSASNPTVYICLRPNEVDSYVSVLRVLIAQHIRVLTTELPPREAQPILFLLDELPRLRQMPPVEEALEIGRQYGLKLWMFAQSLGQLRTAYPNAEGMVGSCAVRMFMNPSLHDETAKKISDDIGFRESIVDGTRVKIVEPNVLAGPDFKDMIVVMAPPAKAARLRKNFAYADEGLAARMGSL